MRVIQKVKIILHVALSRDFAWDVFFPSYSLDLAASDFHVFTHLKHCLDGMRVISNKEVKMFKDWFNGLVAEFCDAGIQNSSHMTNA
jgi:hypothetical protein